MRPYDAIVIGTGLGGLSIAALLSNDNYKVLCLEKNKDVGGRARIMKKDGFTYEYGIHVLRYGPKGACAKILKKIGIEDLEIKKLNVAIYDDKKFHNFSSGGLASLISMGILSKKEKLKFFKEIISLGYGNIEQLYDTSVLELMEKRGYSENLKKVFSSMSTSMLSCPDTSRASAGELAHHLKNVVSKRYAVGYPKGGFETIISHLTNKIKEKNKILLETKALEIMKINDRAAGVRTDRETFFAKNVICAVPPTELNELTNISYAPKPTSGISIDYALSTDEYKEDRVILTSNPKGVAMFTSNVDKSIAPEGKSLLTFFVPAPYSIPPYSILTIGLKNYMDRLAEEMFPGILSKVEHRRILNLQVVDGVELNTEQHYNKRLGNKIGENLYFVGDATKAHGNGGEIAFNSALKCYEEMIKNG